MINLVSVNYIAVLIAAVLAMVIGFVWYSPALFGKQWSKLTGISPEDMKKGENPLMFIKAFATTIVMAYVLAYFVHYSGAYDLVNGIKTGVWVWLGFVATTQFANTMFTRKPMKLFYIDTAHHLAVLMVMGAVIALITYF